MLGAGRYEVSADGKTLTVTNKGSGLQGPFQVVMVLERVVPESRSAARTMSATVGARGGVSLDMLASMHAC